MATRVREIERKYEAPDAGELPDPAESLGFAGELAEQRLTAVYFDTEDLRLLRAGVTLRRREGGSDAGWHLKIPAGKDTREELRLPLGRARRPPAKLLSLARVHSRGAEVAPVAELVTHRKRWRLADADREVAELVDDQVVARTMGEQTTTQSWREVEVELAEHGDVDVLDRVEAWLRTLGLDRSASSSKLGRLLADRLPGTDRPAGRAKPGSAGHGVLGYLRTQADQLRRHDPLVRQDAPDAVHQMRVAARRMRSALRGFGRVLDPERTRPISDELRWMAGELADARDSEVMAERFGELLDGLPDELKLGPVKAQLEREFGSRQADARTRAIAALDSRRYLDLHHAIDELLADPPLTGKARRPAAKELPEGVDKAFRRLKSRMDQLVDLGPGLERDEALHEARKAAKRLRYATEVAGSSLGGRADRLRQRLKEVQELLGDHQDTVVARPVLRELAVKAQVSGGNGFAFGVLYGAEAARAERLEARLPAAWRRLRKLR
ncbi:CHAD domain-containing protein [Pseudonocardia eucalypti]|uniref:CHAD domain-containing protein n=1 Tax=Pseudonocardia eucalypti TaxID=648755 RepID=UPI00161403E4|nr:CHAD domain-containing protein [Pseudonocardia eucalypti]